jgi:uridine kinase
MYPRPFIIAIAGASCSGKTEIAKCIACWAPAVSPVIVNMDSYYLDLSALDPDERERHNFDAPEAIDWDLLIEQMFALSRGCEVEMPVYDFSTHTRAPYTERVKPCDLVIVEGSFSLYRKELRDLYDLTIFVEIDPDIGLGRRLERDLRQRGRTIQSIIRQYSETVKPMYDRHALPTRDFADLRLRGEQAATKSAAKVMAHLNQSFRFQLSAVRL